MTDRILIALSATEDQVAALLRDLPAIREVRPDLAPEIERQARDLQDKIETARRILGAD